MASVRKEILVNATPEQVWDAVRDVGAVHRRLTPGLVLDTQIEGDTRILSFPNGGMAREWIVAIDDEARRLAYSVVEGRMALIHHHATFQVFPDGENHSRLVWTTDFLPHTFAAEIRVRMERGAIVMKQALEQDARQG
jgi:carbon monoxide dehydrogenase subunit G